MRAAVVGAGLAGLSASFFLAKRGYTITLFDEKGIGQGVSSIASGLCHPYPGKEGKLCPFGREGMHETKALLAYVEKKTKKQAAISTSFLRKNWPTYPDEPDLEKCDEGILIHSALLFYMPKYLEALFQVIPNITLVQKRCSLKDDFLGFDRIVFALGSGFRHESISSSLTFNKGQALLVHTDTIYKRPILGNGHLIPLQDSGSVLLGSTYEHNFKDDEPNREETFTKLKKRLESFLPPLHNFHPFDCVAGVRAYQKNSSLPLIKQLDEKRFLFTGLGSKGLIYHALYGRLLSEML